MHDLRHDSARERASVATCVTIDARSDLLFTMSDNTPLRVFRRDRSEFHFWTSTVPNWWSQTGSNRRPPACKAGALPTELWPRSETEGWLASRSARNAQASPFGLRRAVFASPRARRLVGLGRFELPTSRLSSARSNQLSYKPEDPTDRPALVPLRSDCMRSRARKSPPRQLRCNRAQGERRTGSSRKKEKRRRRRPANGAHD